MKKDGEIQRAFHAERELFDYPPLGRAAVPPARWDGPSADTAIPGQLRRNDLLTHLPEVSEVDLVRHFTRLSQLNYSLDAGLYPLGSCTMKYNPKINDWAASLGGFCGAHPYQPEETVQGALELMYGLERALCAITGLDAATLQPAAGAHGELTGIKLIRAALEDKGLKKKNILIPDSAHGTNPASSALCGFSCMQVKSGSDGRIDLADLRSKLNADTAGIMITNPNTLGVFENEIRTICEEVHARGGYVYCDGANLNAMIGKIDLKACGIDVLHINLHKTFSTPHGGGGPGAGPVAVRESLRPYLPVPRVDKCGDQYRLKTDIPKSIGQVRAFYGNFAMLVRAYCYILMHGAEGLKNVAEGAVLNANYLRRRLEKQYAIAYETESLHEFILCDRLQKGQHVTTMDIAKRLIDFGFHPMTVYFPLIVKGAMMIEPTETESLAELDRFVEAMQTVAKEAAEEPEKLQQAPHNVGFRRVDEVKAAKELNLRWKAAR